MKKAIYFTFLLSFICSSGYSQNSFTKMVQKIKPGVFKIITYDRFNSPVKQGTGFFIDSTGLALSNAHVFENAYKAEITTIDGKVLNIPMIISQDKDNDIIKFKVDNRDTLVFPYLEFNEDTLLEGDDVFVVGSPQGLEGTVSNGIIASFRNLEDFGDVIQITAPISRGSSGSPVIRMNGKVFGIATMIYQQGQNLNFAVDVKKINAVETDTIYLNSRDNKNLNPDRIVYLSNGGIITKNYFLKECRSLSGERQFSYGGVNAFCDCYYDRLLSNYSDAEISAMIRYGTVQRMIKKSIQGNEKFYEEVRGCSGSFYWTKNAESNFIKSCQTTIRKSNKASSLDTKKFCNCALQEVKTGLSMQQVLRIVYYMNDMGRSLDNMKNLYKEIPALKDISEKCIEKSLK